MRKCQIRCCETIALAEEMTTMILNPVSLAGQISVKDMGTRVSQEKTSDRPVIKEKDIPKQSNPNNYSYTGTLENISYHPTNEPQTAHTFGLHNGGEINNFLPQF